MNEDFATRLQSERSRLGLSQSAAADLLGVAKGTYAQLESRPARDPRLSTVVRLVGAGFRAEALAPELFVARHDCDSGAETID